MNNYKIFIFCFFNIMLTSCWFDKTKPNIVYMPDMYYSDSYEPYSDPKLNQKKDNIHINIPYFLERKTSSFSPVKNTVPRSASFIYYFITKTKNGYNYSKKITKYPFFRRKNEIKEIMSKGKNLYKINCSICHGENGDGQGLLVKNEKIFGIPNYKDRDITMGSVYYVITYGKNNMGSYASQLNEIERWMVSEYVMSLKNNRINK
ncbi:c-type cytochrome [Blattabacterium cuenoti]|uniref:c-type cytochrome n=1 Tax=Blattabacterium cuenoti TaxID=1653831 RepID=UPI00163C7B15|nr:cytochrome c [Blattabacterium cuenoti]